MSSALAAKYGVDRVVAGAWLFLWILCAGGRLVTSVAATSQGSQEQEVCLTETLEAKCPDGHVILMTSARYGRMRIGRCVKRNFGFLGGCAADVLNMADRACSGRPSCSVDVFKTFGELRPCSELESYLEVTYRCVQVSQGIFEHCVSQGAYQVTDAEGYIPNAVLDPYRHARKSCPFRLQGKPGQRWNITLLDFGIASVPGTPEGMAADARAPVCQRYAVIKEGERQGSMICGGSVREKPVYVSDTSSVSVEVFTIQDEKKARFLLRYKAIGCTDPVIPTGALLRRDELKATVTCNETGSPWLLRCEGDRWVGEMGSCSSAVSWSMWQVLTEDWTTPYGILLVTALGVALGVLIGGILLGIAIVCYKRRMRYAQSESCQPSSVDLEIDIGSQDTLKHERATFMDGTVDSRRLKADYDYKYQRPYPQGQGQGHNEAPTADGTLTGSSTDYGTRVVRHLPPPPYDEGTNGYGSSRGSKYAHNVEHLYEIPH